MKILIIKTSALGDIIHTLPALTDAGKAIPDVRFDWVVEESFAEIPTWHPLVDRIIPVSFKRWRKNPFKTLFSKEWKNFRQALRAHHYDRVIDAQGLIKSALITRMSKGLRVGLDKQSLTEPLARFAYQKKVQVDLQEHAIHRMRSIFAQALDYPLPKTEIDYQLNRKNFREDDLSSDRYIVFLHGTTWPSKHWPDEYWNRLVKLIDAKGYKIKVPWNNTTELERANNISFSSPNASLIPRSNLSKIADIISNATAAIAVDTGLGHLAAALNIPTVSLYGPTNPKRIGTRGKNSFHLVTNSDCRFCDKKICFNEKSTYPRTFSSNCLSQITPKMVLEKLEEMINTKTTI